MAMRYLKLRFPLAQQIDRTACRMLALPEPPRGVFGEVRDDPTRAGPFDRGQCFQSDLALVDPTELRSRLDHGVFTGDVISHDRRVERVACHADYIEIGHRRFHDYDVRALVEI